MKFHHQITAALILAFGVAAETNAGAVVGATEFTQIANNFQLLASYVEQAQQTVHQYNQYMTMLQNLKRSVPSALLDGKALNLWNNQNMVQTFKNLRTIYQNGKRMAYSLQGQAEAFKRLHPGYKAPFSSKDSYSDWSEDSHAAVDNALAVSGVQADNIEDEQDMVRELQSRAQSADGQLSMMKAGNDIGVAMIGQMQQLRQLQIAQMTSQAHYMKTQTSMQDRAKQGSAIFLGNIKSSKVVQGNKNVPSDSGE
jgi:type IV secretion system protein TrbJ